MSTQQKNVRFKDHQLAKLRKACGVTQHWLAREVNIPVNRLVFAETGRTELEPEIRSRIMQVLRQRAKKVSKMVA